MLVAILLVGCVPKSKDSWIGKLEFPKDLDPEVEAERLKLVFSEFLKLKEQDKLPGLAKDERGTCQGFRLLDEIRQSWLTDFMRKDIANCTNAFLLVATPKVDTNRAIWYLFCENGQLVELVSSYRKNGGRWQSLEGGSAKK